MSDQIKSSTLSFIQKLRGFALLSVVGIHSLSYFTTLSPENSLLGILTFIAVFFIFAVPLFVWISGFVLAYRYTEPFSLITYYRKRLGSVLPAYLFFSMLYLLFASFQIASLRWSFPSCQQIFVQILTGSAYSHLWFILLVLQLYIIYPLCCRAKFLNSIQQKPFFWLALCLVFQTIWQIVIPMISPHFFLGLPYGSSLTLLASRSFPSYLFFFIAGIYTGKQYQINENFIHQLKVPWIALLAVAISGAYYISQQWIEGINKFGSFYAMTEMHRLGEKIIFPFLYGAIILLLLQISIRNSKKNILGFHYLEYFGNRSFGVYLLHAGILVAIAQILFLMGLKSTQWSFYPILFAMVLLLSLGAEEIVARLPYSQYLIGRKFCAKKLNNRH